jgi:hypothetical protein
MQTKKSIFVVFLRKKAACRRFIDFGDFLSLFFCIITYTGSRKNFLSIKNAEAVLADATSWMGYYMQYILCLYFV